MTTWNKHKRQGRKSSLNVWLRASRREKTENMMSYNQTWLMELVRDWAEKSRRAKRHFGSVQAKRMESFLESQIETIRPWRTWWTSASESSSIRRPGVPGQLKLAKAASPFWKSFRLENLLVDWRYTPSHPNTKHSDATMTSTKRPSKREKQLATEIQQRICRFLIQKISPIRQYQSCRQTLRAPTEEQ